jgi:hypothetical protein
MLIPYYFALSRFRTPSNSDGGFCDIVRRTHDFGFFQLRINGLDVFWRDCRHKHNIFRQAVNMLNANSAKFFTTKQRKRPWLEKQKYKLYLISMTLMVMVF